MKFNISKIILSLLLSINLFGFDFFDNIVSKNTNAMPFGIISIPLPNLDQLGEEGNLFFDEFSTDVYSLYNNGIIQISNKYKTPVKIKDIGYRYNQKTILLIPNSENPEQIEAIDSFYSQFRNKGKKLLKQLAIENKVVAIAFGHISNSQVKKAIKNGTLQFAIKIFLVQSEATMFKPIKIKVDDLATDPYYNPEDLVINVEKKILEAYSQVIATIQQSGNVLDTLEYEYKESKNNQDKEPKNKEEEETHNSKVLEKNKQQAFKELEEGSDDDW